MALHHQAAASRLAATPTLTTMGGRKASSGFGRNGGTKTVVRTEWKTDDIWLRREFTMQEGTPDDPGAASHPR